MSVTQNPSKTAYADALLARDDLPSDARVLLARTREDWEADPREVLNRPERDRLLGVGPTRGRELEKQGLPAYLGDNGKRLTPASLVYIYKLDRILASFPPDGPPLKAPGAPHMRAKRPRSHPKKQPELVRLPAE